jgi:hypothetical protein
MYREEISLSKKKAEDSDSHVCQSLFIFSSVFYVHFPPTPVALRNPLALPFENEL